MKTWLALAAVAAALTGCVLPPPGHGHGGPSGGHHGGPGHGPGGHGGPGHGGHGGHR